ncbi:MAG TPA: phospholipase D-like domain-containing protein [Kofleriaceae bacterium]|nr:phospholipase D-like domain-containing protein [Kofleriaceae bacterium]
MITWLVTHLTSIAVAVLTLVFAASILSQRRTTGSAVAWLLAVVMIPYIGIPLYLALGGRKFRRASARKKPLVRHVRTVASSAPPTIEWLDDGIHAYEAFLREIKAAKRGIRIEMYLIGNDQVGVSVLEALAERARAGVEVHLLIDDLLIASTPRGPARALAEAGGHVRRFMPLLHVPFRGRANLRLHRKIAVFDGERAIVGGMNLAEEYMGPTKLAERWRDLSLVIDGGAVASLDAIFCADWEFATKTALLPFVPDAPGPPTDIEVIPSGPDSPSDAIYDQILTMVFRAERRLWVATPYYVPDDPLARALEIAARRGVDVRVVVPAKSNHCIADLVAGPLLRELELGGGRVYRYTPGMLHAKVVFADDRAIVGSANFDMRSMFLDYEVAIAFSGSREVDRVAQWFEATFVDTTVGARRSAWFRAHVEATARLVAPLV